MSYITPEKRIQNAIINYLKPFDQYHTGALYWERRNAAGSNYKKGLPDLYVVIGSTHIEVEVKAPGELSGRSSCQEKWESIFNKIGVPYIVTDSLEKFIEFISPYIK